MPAGRRKGAYKIRESIKHVFVSLIATHPMLGYTRQAWILDSTPWIPVNRNCVQFFVSVTWILDYNRYWDAGSH